MCYSDRVDAQTAPTCDQCRRFDASVTPARTTPRTLVGTKATAPRTQRGRYRWGAADCSYTVGRCWHNQRLFEQWIGTIPQKSSRHMNCLSTEEQSPPRKLTYDTCGTLPFKEFKKKSKCRRRITDDTISVTHWRKCSSGASWC